MSQDLSLPYKTTQVNQLLFERKPALIKSIRERQQHKIYPISSVGQNIAASQTLTFEISGDNLLDTKNLTLGFQMHVTGTDQNDAKIANAFDVISSYKVYYNSELIDEADEANSILNTFLRFNMNRSYKETEADAMFAYREYKDEKASYRSCNNEHFLLPLALMIPCFRTHSYWPLLGGTIKIILQLETDHNVLVKMANADNIYELYQPYIIADMVILEDAYRNELIRLVTQDTLRIGYTSYNVQIHGAQTASNQMLRINHGLSNLLSLHILYNNVVSKDAATKTNWHFNKSSFAFGTTANPRYPTRFVVKSGSKQYTLDNENVGACVLYKYCEQTLTSMADLSGSGTIDYKTFLDQYHSDTDAKYSDVKAGVLPMSCSFEKQTIDDFNTINNGISSMSNGNSAYIEAYMRITSDKDGVTPANLDQGNHFICILVHKRALVFSQGSISVEK